MLTADECRAKAKEMSDLVEDALPEHRKHFVWLSRSWEDMAMHADWQDGFTLDA